VLLDGVIAHSPSIIPPQAALLCWTLLKRLPLLTTPDSVIAYKADSLYRILQSCLGLYTENNQFRPGRSRARLNMKLAS